MPTAAPSETPGDVGVVDPHDVEEGGDLVGIGLGRVGAGRLVAVARAGKIDRDAAEVLGIGRQLERIAGVVGGEVRDEQERIAVALHLVVDREPIYLDLRHAHSLLSLVIAAPPSGGYAQRRPACFRATCSALTRRLQAASAPGARKPTRRCGPARPLVTRKEDVDRASTWNARGTYRLGYVSEVIWSGTSSS